MFLRILKKDLKRNKTMNIIILLFVILCSMFAAASVTDVLDGYIARKFNQISDLGKLLDPLADKLMTMAMLIMLALRRYIPIWVPVAAEGFVSGVAPTYFGQGRHQ